MAGENNNQTAGIDMAAVIAAALAQYTAGGGAIGGSGQVYIGTKKVKVPATIALPGKTVQEVPNVLSTQQLVSMYLNDPKMQSSWRKTMQRNGLETGNPIAERKVFEAAVAGASDWYTTSNGQQKVTPENYLTWYASGQKKRKPSLPTRQVYAVTPDQIESDINEIMVNKAGRTVTESDKQMGWYQDLVKGINELYSQGVVTSTKEVRNPKTGKMERVVTQTPGFSKEQIQEKIGATIEVEDPASVERKKRIDNTKWLLSRGGQG